MERVGVRINEERLLENLRYAFTNRTTVLTRLMQNRARPKASVRGHRLRRRTETWWVRDDGVGHRGFPGAVHGGESGWEAATVATSILRDGFMKSLYRPGHCTVRSRGKVIASDRPRPCAARGRSRWRLTAKPP